MGPCGVSSHETAGRIVATRSWERLGFARLADYARERVGLSAREVYDLAHVDERLRALPRIEAALVSGALSWTKARLLARVAAADDEERWVAFARRDDHERARARGARDRSRRGRVGRPRAGVAAVRRGPASASWCAARRRCRRSSTGRAGWRGGWRARRSPPGRAWRRSSPRRSRRCRTSRRQHPRAPSSRNPWQTRAHRPTQAGRRLLQAMPSSWTLAFASSSQPNRGSRPRWLRCSAMRPT